MKKQSEQRSIGHITMDQYDLAKIGSAFMLCPTGRLNSKSFFFSAQSHAESLLATRVEIVAT